MIGTEDRVRAILLCSTELHHGQRSTLRPGTRPVPMAHLPCLRWWLSWRQVYPDKAHDKRPCRRPTTTQVLLIIGITGMALASVVSGMDKGIKRLCEANLLLALLLLAFVLVVAARRRPRGCAGGHPRHRPPFRASADRHVHTWKGLRASTAGRAC